MDLYSKLNGTAPISPGSDGIFKIQKKRKTDDRQRRNEKKKKKGKGEKDIHDSPIHQENEKQGHVDSFDTDEQVGYGSGKKKKQVRRKIDLTI